MERIPEITHTDSLLPISIQNKTLISVREKLTFSCIGVHTFNIIRYGTVPVFFIQFRYSNGTDTGYFLYWSMFSIRFCRAR